MSNIERSTIDFQVDPPDEWADMAMVAEAERIVAALNDEQCDAVAWALAVRTVANGRAALPSARRKVGFLEAFLGVECCNPAVVRHWRRYRLTALYLLLCLPVVIRIAMVGQLVLLPLFVGACLLSLSLWWTMTRGSASVCH